MEDEMSNEFYRALGLNYYHKEHAIELYRKDLEKNPDNYASYNNMGFCKVEIGIDKKNLELIEEGKKDLQKAIELAQKVDIKYYLAEGNLERANGAINELKK